MIPPSKIKITGAANLGSDEYVVYLGLRNYQAPAIEEARRQLAQKSLELFLRDWRKNGHVHENYNGATGDGDDVPNSDRFYHWGALLGLIDLDEQTHKIRVESKSHCSRVRSSDSQIHTFDSIEDC